MEEILNNNDDNSSNSFPSADEFKNNVYFF